MNRYAYLKKVRNKPDKEVFSPIPGYTVLFFTLFMLNTIIPLYDLPLVGLSLTAPLMLIIAIQVFLKPAFPWFSEYKIWWNIAIVIWVAWFITAVINSFLGRLDAFSTSQILYFIRTAYWLFVMVITAYVVSQKVNGSFLVKVLNFGIFVLGLMRLAEAIIFGRIGAGTSQILAQNVYGIIFSSFAIFPMILFIEEKGWKKVFQFLIIIVVFSSIVLNVSRSNWVAFVIGLFVLIIFLLIARRIKVGSFLFFIISLILLFLLLELFFPGIGMRIDTESPIVERFLTFQNLDKDASFATRQYLLKKAWAQFRSSPIIGVGIERGKFVFMDVEIPEALIYERGLTTRSINEHNSYIQILAETGIVGSIPFIIFLAILTTSGFRSASHLAKRGSLWAVGVYVSFISMSIHLWTITALRNTSAWFVYGLVAGMIMFWRKQKNSDL